MDVKERIYKGCIEEFRDNGLKFTMDCLAKKIGISKRTLYETISSKEELVSWVLERTFEDVKIQQRNILANDTLTTIEKIKELLNVVPTYAQILDYRRLHTLRQNYPEFYKKVQDYIESDWDATLNLLQQGMEEGVIKEHNLVVLKMLLCGIFERALDGEELLMQNITYETALKEMMGVLFEGLQNA